MGHRKTWTYRVCITNILQALNGGMHRDTFKDAIADIIVATRKV